MAKLLSIVLLSVIAWDVRGGDPRYPVNAISEELKANVNAVIREDHMVFRIHAKNRASYYVHQVITILNAKGKRFASEVVGYDKLSKIRELSASVYDAAGKQIKRLKNSEIYDQSAFDGFSLYSDNRFKAIDLSQGAYPYTVEFRYEVELKFLFFIPTFYVVPGEKISVEKSSYTLEYPAGLEPRYQARNTSVEPVKGQRDDGTQFITWSFENVMPIRIEPYSSASEVLTTISAAPDEFEYDGYPGKMASWDELGQWISSLNRGRNNLPESTKEAIRQMTGALPSREEKIKALYEYLQNKTRYVSIQLGIGGFQPFEAAVVDQTGYGDCKALSNYMVSMLEAIGIKGYYTLIDAGENARPLDTAFPSSQFNHAIVMVPNGMDTVWLECTSQTNPFAYQGLFTGDRKALIITDNGAEVVNTTRYSAEQNVRTTSAVVQVSETGDAKAIVKTVYTGLQYEKSHLNRVLNNQYDDQRKWIQGNTNIPTFDINSFSIENHKERIPAAVVNLDLSLQRFANVTGKRMFLTPNLMTRATEIPEKVDNRTTRVVSKMTYTQLDTIRFQLPEGIYPEFLPEPVTLNTRFGEYQAAFQVDQGNLVYIRKVKMNKGEFPPESYQELIDFYRGMMKADHTKVVFLSKT